MNVSDSERVATSLARAGYEIVANEAAADVVLLNTCSVREKAENKLYTRVGEIRSNKREANVERRESKNKIVGVMGCVAQLEGENLLRQPNKIDFVVGTAATGRVVDLIREATEKNAQAFDLADRENDYDWNVSPAQRQTPYVAFVPIIEGCNKFCTYCIVPFSRGRERSRPAPEIVREVERLRAEGVREIYLIGQNVNSYRPRTTVGLENYSGATPFVKLLRAVAATRIERIKFTTSFPRDFHADIVAAINEHENLCNWVHLPVQSGSDRVLKLMRRGHQIASYRRHIEAIKNSPRQIALSSDLIVGFPGETDHDFEQTVELIENCEFDSLYIFKYSPRPGTPAAALADDVPAPEKQARFERLDRLQKSLQTKIWRGYEKRTVRVLAEKPSAKNKFEISGHSTCNKVVNFVVANSADNEIDCQNRISQHFGKIFAVEIVAAKANSLSGVALDNGY